MNLDILRTQQLPAGTFGAWTLRNEPGAIIFQCVHLEDDWRDNQPMVSCIPAGDDFVFIRHVMQHWKDWKGNPAPLATWMLENVPGRSGICAHPATTEEQVEGCFGIGRAFALRDVAEDEDTHEKNVKKQGLVGGEEAHAEFMRLTAGESRIPTTVRWAPGLPRAA